MRVWIVIRGQYSSAFPCGVYSSLELAKQAVALDPGELSLDDEEGFEVDQNAALIRSGVSRWEVHFSENGDVVRHHSCGLPTGDGVSFRKYTAWHNGGNQGHICVSCDAADGDHAIKIAADARAQILTTTSANP